MLDIEQMSRFVSPVNPSIFPHLTTLLLGIGIFYTAWFFVYEVTSTKVTRELVKELALAVMAAIFMGAGTVFLALTVGIYV
ncbi:transmembrane protein 258-like isoform X1 [Amphibalanus amphitrite]|uniref:transmembrane protein 258-like isoform X1 n=1 Tax=Amphibalanus amphitrite TaxID=1232801 RepID=UPI001C913704|nr:transmembrane protein 258-like isoform X1 [Amphibalanus amphitrite]XP_043192102.1 transmembrane protein 258-like isoform X1 [Amphibalanus amphitrite]